MTSLDEDVVQQFNKVFVLSDKVRNLPPCEKWFRKMSDGGPPQEFVNMRDELNGVKSLLNSMPLAKWHKHTRNQNPAGFVINEVRKVANPELLTQAWCKFTEILWHFPELIPLENEDFQTFHVCEAPGAFITALNHHLQSNRKDLNWSWTGSTLNPYYEGNTTGNMINDDRFILHTLKNWDFGSDDSGDILKVSNLRYYCNQFKDQIHLTTADGSIDCQNDPARQEALVIELHFAEIIIAIGTLKKGGDFVLKMFTFFESGTISHLCLLSCLFGKITVMKPATSKEGNSEVYVVCQDFQGISAENLEKLIEGFVGKNLFVDATDIDPDFLEQVEKCANYFKALQTSVIRRNLCVFESADKSYQKLKVQQKKSVASKFISDFNIVPITQRIVMEKVNCFVDECRQTDERVDIGTFQDRINPKTKEELIQSVKEKLSKLYPSWLPRCRKVEWLSTSEIRPLPKILPSTGTSFAVSQSSKFCPSRAINLYKQSLDLVELEKASSPINIGSQKKRKLDLIKFYPLKSLHIQTPILRNLTQMYPELLDIETLVVKAPLSKCILANNSKDSLDLLHRITEALSTLELGQHLILMNWVMLTRVDVGIFHLLSQQFEEIGFVRPLEDSHGILLSEFKGHLDKERYEELQTTLLNHQDGSLMSFLPIEYLTREPLYSLIVAHNMNIMREMSISKLKQL